MKHLQMGFMALRLPGSNWDSRNWKGTSAAWTLKDIIEALLESSAALPCRGTCAILPGQSCPPVLICFARLVVVESSLVLCVRFGLFYGSFSQNVSSCGILKVSPDLPSILISQNIGYRRKFRSQTSDNMDRWKSRGGKSQRREEKRRRKKIREEKESEERRCRRAKR